MTCDQTVALNGVVIDGTDPDADYILEQDGISGLGVPDHGGRDLARADEHGSVTGADFTQARQLRVPVIIRREDDPEGAMTALRALKTAWAPAAVDQVLSVTIPGLGPSDDTLRWWGRPRGRMPIQTRSLHLGVVYCLCTFVALDPIGYGPLESQAATGSFTVTNDGDAESRRAVFTIVGNGGTPLLVNESDDDADIEFSQLLDTGDEATVDLLARTVTVEEDSGDFYSDSGTAASVWPRLVPGVNTWQLTGAASGSIEHRHGWW